MAFVSPGETTPKSDIIKPISSAVIMPPETAAESMGERPTLILTTRLGYDLWAYAAILCMPSRGSSWP